MRNLKDKLKDLDKGIKKKWDAIDSSSGLSTREKLEKLVSMNVRRQRIGQPKESPPIPEKENGLRDGVAFIVRDYTYPLSGTYRRIRLEQWREVQPQTLALLAQRPEFAEVDPLRIVFLDTETTGLAGGTGTIPFMIGFGYIEENAFLAKIFVLMDLNREGEMLAAVDEFLRAGGFSALVTFNGRAFDVPLLEARYILQRRRCPLLSMPHLDFLFPARTLWRHTYDSRRLGFLAETLLGISRGDDIDASEIPALYVNFLRTRMFSLVEPVIEHNALDLVSLSAVLLLALLYLADHSLTADEGELLGLAVIFERNGRLDKAGDLFRTLKESARRAEVLTFAVRRFASLLKRQKLFDEAAELWRILAEARHHQGFRELSVHYEHREKNIALALKTVQSAIEKGELSERIREEMEKRLQRLQRKLDRLEQEEGDTEE